MNNLNRMRYLRDLIKENPNFIKRFINFNAIESEILLRGLDTYKRNDVSEQIATTEKLSYHPFLCKNGELCLISCDPTEFRIKLSGKGGEEKGIEAMHKYGEKLYSNRKYNAAGDVLSYEYFCELPGYLKLLELTDKLKSEQEYYDRMNIKLKANDDREYILASFIEDQCIGSKFEEHENIQIYLVNKGRCYAKMVNNKNPYSRLLTPNVNNSMRVLIHLADDTLVEINDMEKDGKTRENPLNMIVGVPNQYELWLEQRVNSLEDELREMREEIRRLKLR